MPAEEFARLSPTQQTERLQRFQPLGRQHRVAVVQFNDELSIQHALPVLNGEQERYWSTVYPDSQSSSSSSASAPPPATAALPPPVAPAAVLTTGQSAAGRKRAASELNVLSPSTKQW